MLISKKEFKKLIEDYQDFQKYLDKLYDLKIEIINSQLHEYPCLLFDNIIKMFFDEEGEDWISYYLYELPSLGEGEHVFDEDNKPISLNNVDDLWKLVKEYRK